MCRPDSICTIQESYVLPESMYATDVMFLNPFLHALPFIYYIASYSYQMFSKVYFNTSLFNVFYEICVCCVCAHSPELFVIVGFVGSAGTVFSGARASPLLRKAFSKQTNLTWATFGPLSNDKKLHKQGPRASPRADTKAGQTTASSMLCICVLVAYRQCLMNCILKWGLGGRTF